MTFSNCQPILIHVLYYFYVHLFLYTICCATAF
nr:MAG TPA: hypothetical protein [Caudoviricetes sp.]